MFEVLGEEMARSLAEGARKEKPYREWLVLRMRGMLEYLAQTAQRVRQPEPDPRLRLRLGSDR